VRERFGDSRLVVRSSARGEDSFTASNAGGYDSVLGVDVTTGLDDAVERVAASYGPGSDDEQVLVQPMVEGVVVAGVAFTRTLEHGAPWMVVNFDVTDDTASITGGGSTGHRTLVVRRAVVAAGTPPAVVTDSPVAPLFATLVEIERLLGHDALDVEFALDAAGTVHVLQVRPLVVGEPDVTDEDCDRALEAAHARWRERAASPAHLPGGAAPLFGVMPDWNPAEIIGTSPGALAVSLYRDLIMDEVWAAQRAGYGYRDVRPAPLLESFAGRPYVDVRASFASFLPAGLDEGLAGRLLVAALDRLRARPELHDKVEFAVVPTCVDPDVDRWRVQLAADGFAPGEVDALLAGLTDITARALGRGAQERADVDALVARAAEVAAADLDPVGLARVLLDDARRLGTLAFAHLARSAFVAVSLLRGAEAAGVLTSAAVEGFLGSIRTVGHELTHDARAVADGTLNRPAFVARYGHLRPGTYDVVSPRYDADPERYLDPLVAHAAAGAGPSGTDVSADADAGAAAWERERPALLEALAALGLPSDAATVETFLRRSIEGREWAKFVFTRNLSDALEALVAAAALHGIARGDLADVPLTEALTLDVDADAATVARVTALARSNARARRITAACELPPLLTCEDDLDAFVLGAETPNFVGSSAVIAGCIELGPAAQGEGGVDGTQVAGRIALVPQADPGYDWLFGQGIVGLVTQYGGANSHMAIRAAEFGLPAAIGVGEQRYRQVTGAAVIELDPANRLLRVLR
jgi:glutamine kinase